MAVVQNLYQVFKLPASMLVKNNCNIENYTLSKGLKEGTVVSIGDNLVFQQLRYIHQDFRDHTELFNYVTKIRKAMHEYKKNGQHKEARILEQEISKVLFVKDIVNVNIDGKKSDFNQFRTKGFYLNGIHYIYLCSGSGQIRRNTATFINDEYYKTVVKTLNCGLDEKTSEFVLAKYSAYFALAFSSILWVRTPRVCVIKDFYNTLKQEPVDFIYHDENDGGKAKIEERKLDLELNCADGQGLIDPEFAKLWSEDMSLKYTPCSFVVRSCFIKGNLATFDFKQYAYDHNITTIKDRWGKVYNIKDIDVLLSESQFKTYKYYSSWQEYSNYMTKGNIHWGVARYNKIEDEEYVLANYQYIQSLTLNTEDIKELIAPTVEWIQQICSGDLLYAMLYAFGNKSVNVEYNNLYGSAKTIPMRALIKNANFLDDTYVQQKLYKNITESINHAKIGKIWIHGNYQFMIADPVAQCQSALGLPVTGVLKRDEIWSKFWIDRFNKQLTPIDQCIVDTCRSPMIDQHEHNPMHVSVDNTEANRWLKYLTSGIVYNIYDTSCFRHEDSDYDGDIVLVTDNKFFIKGSHKDHNIITYEKGAATPAKMTINNITATVMKGFGTGVGGFSNTATILYAMAAIFDKPGHEDQYQEIMTRIKLLREIVGQEIDRIKGADKPSLPPEWKKIEQINPQDSQDEVIRKMRRNAMVVCKKPYFFRYLYPELNSHYKQFEASYNQISRDMFGIKFKKLLVKENKTEEEKNLIRRYQKYSPLITAPCTMNKLCKEFESVDFDIKFDRPDSTSNTGRSMLPTFDEEFSANYDEAKAALVKELYKEYISKRQIKHLTNILAQTTIQDDDYQEYRSTVYDDILSRLRDKMAENNISAKELLFYANKISAGYKTFNWGFAWELLDEQILTLIPQGETFCPIKDDEDGEYYYLGNNYSLKDISKFVENDDEFVPTTEFMNDYTPQFQLPEEDDYSDIDLEEIKRNLEGYFDN